MIRYLIKNNFKIMVRSISNILLFIATPVILISLLSSAFDSMMKKYEDVGKIEAGYRVAGEGTSAEMINALKQVAEKNGILLHEYQQKTPEELIREEELGGFLVFEEGHYTVYGDQDNPEQGKALEYLVSSFFEKAAKQGSHVDPSTIDIRTEHPDFMAAISAKDYYGIIEVIYIGWCAIVCGAGLFTAEKKYRINKKIQVSGISDTKFYLSRFVPVFLAVVLGTIVTIGLTILMFGIHWGSPLLSALVVLFSCGAATAFGLMFYNITENVVITIIAMFMIVWIMGFCGGSFETYMFSSLPEGLKQMSPIYHINRSLVEMSCAGNSDHVPAALAYSGAIIVVSSAVSILAGKIRKRGRA